VVVKAVGCRQGAAASSGIPTQGMCHAGAIGAGGAIIESAHTGGALSIPNLVREWLCGD